MEDADKTYEEVKMDRNIIIVAVLALLLIVSTVQAVQLAELKSKVGSGKFVGSASATVTPLGGAGGAGGAGDISQLPSMVGGC